MGDHQLQELTSLTHQLSTEYAEKATALSNFLEEFERLLQEMPGKIEVRVDNDKGGMLLSRFGDGWYLIIDPKQSKAQRLGEASVEAKITAASLCRPLIECLVEVQKRKLEKLSTGLETMESFMNEWKGV